MNMAEGAAMRALQAQVNALETAVKDLSRRMDDLSAAERKRTDGESKTLGLKKAANG